MVVYIVMKNGKVDAVFTDKALAENHRKNLTIKWNLTDLIEKEVYDF